VGLDDQRNNLWCAVPYSIRQLDLYTEYERSLIRYGTCQHALNPWSNAHETEWAFGVSQRHSKVRPFPTLSAHLAITTALFQTWSNQALSNHIPTLSDPSLICQGTPEKLGWDKPLSRIASHDVEGAGLQKSPQKSGISFNTPLFPSLQGKSHYCILLRLHRRSLASSLGNTERPDNAGCSVWQGL
jgi:hypothetical protein